MATTCETCAHYNRQTQRCGAYDMPAELARARPLLCGDAGSDHRPATNPFMQPIDWLALVTFLLIAIAAFIGAAMEGGPLARLVAVLS